MLSVVGRATPITFVVFSEHSRPAPLSLPLSTIMALRSALTRGMPARPPATRVARCVCGDGGNSVPFSRLVGIALSAHLLSLPPAPAAPRQRRRPGGRTPGKYTHTTRGLVGAGGASRHRGEGAGIGPAAVGASATRRVTGFGGSLCPPLFCARAAPNTTVLVSVASGCGGGGQAQGRRWEHPRKQGRTSRGEGLAPFAPRKRACSPNRRLVCACCVSTLPVRRPGRAVVVAGVAVSCTSSTP